MRNSNKNPLVITWNYSCNKWKSYVENDFSIFHVFKIMCFFFFFFFLFNLTLSLCCFLFCNRAVSQSRTFTQSGTQFAIQSTTIPITTTLFLQTKVYHSLVFFQILLLRLLGLRTIIIIIIIISSISYDIPFLRAMERERNWIIIMVRRHHQLRREATSWWRVNMWVGSRSWTLRISRGFVVLWRRRYHGKRMWWVILLVLFFNAGQGWGGEKGRWKKLGCYFKVRVRNHDVPQWYDISF